MKYFAGILLLTILFISVKPGMEMFTATPDTEMGCCGESPINEEGNPIQADNHDSPCSQGTCNPFIKCGTCTIVFLSTSFYSIHKPISFLTFNYNLEITFSSYFVTDVWEPPKIV